MGLFEAHGFGSDLGVAGEECGDGWHKRSEDDGPIGVGGWVAVKEHGSDVSDDDENATGAEEGCSVVFHVVSQRCGFVCPCGYLPHGFRGWKVLYALNRVRF